MLKGRCQMAELTPFPDGEGYLEYAWAGMSEPRLRAMRGQPLRAINYQTLGGLVSAELVVQDGNTLRVTKRGQDLLDWARRTGRLTDV